MSFAGLIAWDVKVKEGRDSAAAQTLDEDEEGGLAGPVGEEGEATAAEGEQQHEQLLHQIDVEPDGFF